MKNWLVCHSHRCAWSRHYPGRPLHTTLARTPDQKLLHQEREPISRRSLSLPSCKSLKETPRVARRAMHLEEASRSRRPHQQVCLPVVFGRAKTMQRYSLKHSYRSLLRLASSQKQGQCPKQRQLCRCLDPGNLPIRVDLKITLWGNNHIDSPIL